MMQLYISCVCSLWFTHRLGCFGLLGGSSEWKAAPYADMSALEELINTIGEQREDMEGKLVPKFHRLVYSAALV